MEFEDILRIYLGLRDIHQNEVYSNLGWLRHARTLAGDANALDERPGSYLPKRFKLSDEAFMKIVSSKDYYAYIDAGYNRNAGMLYQVERMKAKAEETLARLEEL